MFVIATRTLLHSEVLPPAVSDKRLGAVSVRQWSDDWRATAIAWTLWNDQTGFMESSAGRRRGVAVAATPVSPSSTPAQCRYRSVRSHLTRVWFRRRRPDDDSHLVTWRPGSVDVPRVYPPLTVQSTGTQWPIQAGGMEEATNPRHA